MASKLVIKSGIAEGVYDDRLLPLYEALGMPVITRASNVEYSHVLKLWVAVHVRRGGVIASGKDRREVIAREIEVIEGGL